jgi:hypothetical protein
MGDRANYVLISDGQAKAFYDHWGALSCIYEFADGPVDAAALAEQMDTTAKLMDWAFAEGGFLIDFDQKQAIVFGRILVGPEEFDKADPKQIEEFRRIAQALETGSQEYLRSIASRWVGWCLIWDDRGVDAFSAYLEQRGICSIACEPPSHPPDWQVVSYQA